MIESTTFVLVFAVLVLGVPLPAAQETPARPKLPAVADPDRIAATLPEQEVR